MSVLDYLRMLRPLNCLMSSMAVLIGGLLVIGWNFQHISGYTPLYPALAAVFLIAGAGNVINDYFDVESDKINRPKRPIPSGKVSRRGALAFSVGLFIIGILIAGLINWITFVIAVVNSVALILYSSHLQNKILLGNLSIGYLTGSTFLFGGAAMNNLVLPIWLALLAGLSTISREIVKDMEDVEGDRKGFLKRLTSKFKDSVSAPIAERFGVTTKGVQMRINKGRALFLAAFTLLLSVALSPLPYLFGILGFNYLIAVIPTDLLFLIAILQINRINGKSNYKSIQRTIKLGMFLGLIAFIIGVFF